MSSTKSKEIPIFLTDNWRWKGVEEITAEIHVDGGKKFVEKPIPTRAGILAGTTRIYGPGFHDTWTSVAKSLAGPIRKSIGQMQSEVEMWEGWTNTAKRKIAELEVLLEKINTNSAAELAQNPRAGKKRAWH